MLCKLVCCTLTVSTSINIHLFTNIPPEFSILRFPELWNIFIIMVVAHFISQFILETQVCISNTQFVLRISWQSNILKHTSCWSTCTNPHVMPEYRISFQLVHLHIPIRLKWVTRNSRNAHIRGTIQSRNSGIIISIDVIQMSLITTAYLTAITCEWSWFSVNSNQYYDSN